MTPQNFIQEKLSKLANKYTMYNFKLWSDAYSDSYFIEVDPHSFELDSTFLEDEFLFIEEFHSAFINDDVTFITKDDKLTLDGLTLISEYSRNIIEWADFKNTNILIDSKQTSSLFCFDHQYLSSFPYAA